MKIPFMKKKNKLNPIEAISKYMDLYISSCLDDSLNDWRSDEKAVDMMEKIESGFSLAGADLEGVNLTNAVIKGADLRNANFQGAILVDTTFIDCDVSGANFAVSHWENVVFKYTNLKNVNLDSAYIFNVQLQNVIMDEEERQRIQVLNELNAKIRDGTINLADCSWTDLMNMDIEKLNLKGVNLEGVDLSCVDLRNLNLCGTYIDPKQLKSLEGLLLCQERVANQKLKEKLKQKIAMLRIMQGEKEKESRKMSPKSIAKNEPQKDFPAHQDTLQTKRVGGQFYRGTARTKGE